jgi:hypothetical protein
MPDGIQNFRRCVHTDAFQLLAVNYHATQAL